MKRHRKSLSQLQLHHLEDRTVPSARVPDLSAFKATDYRSDQVLVRLDANTAATTLGAQNKHMFGDWYSVPLNGKSVTQGLSDLSRLSFVNYVEPDYIVHVDNTPNDPNFSQLWGMTKIGAPTAWDTWTGTGNTIVGVIDTGIDYNHPDIAANMWRNPGEIPNDNIDNDNNGYIDDYYGWDFANNDNNPFDDNGHGTHTSGTVGAVGNNAVGVVGVNWNVKLMALKFLAANGSGSTSAAVTALQYATRMGAKVTNNSWGGGGYSQAMYDAINAANSAGSIFVAAAGNNSSNNDTTANYPSNYALPNVVAVAATDQNDNLASFSNYGATTVDIGAPGVAILSTVPGNGYTTYSGTSMASPHVAGAIALVRDQNPTWTNQQIIDRILQTGDTVTSLVGKTITGKRLNIGAAINRNTGTPGDTAGPKITGAVASGPTQYSISNLRVTFSESIDSATFTTADVRVTAPAGVTMSGLLVTAVAGSNNTQFDISFTAQTATGNYTFSIGPDISDLSGNKMDQNNNGVKGENPGDVYTITSAVVAAPTGIVRTYSANGLPKNIPDGGALTSSINVTDRIMVRDVNVTINISHPYVGDLFITLTNPSGKVATLIQRRGANGQNMTGTIFDDESTRTISGGFAPFTGSYQPETPLRVFDNLNSRGNWVLRVEDQATMDAGSLLSWSLTITTDGPTGAKVAGPMETPAMPSASLNLPVVGGAAPTTQSKKSSGLAPAWLPAGPTAKDPLSAPSASRRNSNVSLSDWMGPSIADLV